MLSASDALVDRARAVAVDVLEAATTDVVLNLDRAAFHVAGTRSRTVGWAELAAHLACDDAGRILNPTLVDGQVHGGIAQGAAQVLFEHMAYDDVGNPLTVTLGDYVKPSAAELPSFERVEFQTETPINALGVKGIGESGTIGATPALQSAVIDALGYLGVRHLHLPITPERIWWALEKAALG